MKVLILLSFFISLHTSAHPPEAEIRELFEKYDQLMSGKNLNSKDVFTQSFLEEFEGRDLNYKIEKADYQLQISSGVKDKNLFFVKRVFPGNKKEKNVTTFIIVREKSSWRIQGTISDDL